MTLSNEWFFALFGLLMIASLIWFVKSATAYKKWVKSRYADPKSQVSERPQ